MRWKRYVVSVVVCAIAAAGLGWAGPAQAADTTLTWDLSQDMGRDYIGNPIADSYGDADVWSFLRTPAGADASQSTLLPPAYDLTGCRTAIHRSTYPFAVAYHYGAVAEPCGTATYPARSAILHPDSNGVSAAIRWTSPVTGRVTFAANAADADSGGGDGFTLRVAPDGQDPYEVAVDNGRAAQISYSGDTVRAGQSYTVLIGPRADNTYDSTAVRISVSVTGARPAAPTISGSPAAGSVGSAYSFTYAASGPPKPTTAVTSGTLPPGLQLSASGTLSGTPTTAGTYRFTVTAGNAGGSSSTTSTLTVTPPPAPPGKPTVTGVRLGDGQATVSFTPGTTGVPATTSYAVTATPAGGSGSSGGSAVVSPSSSGSPITVTGLTNGDLYTFAVTATNATGSATSSATAPTRVGVPATISGTPPDGTAGAAYTFDYTVDGKPAPITSVTGGTVPPGLRLGSSGTLSGTPTSAGSYTFTVTAANSLGSASTDSTLTVAPAPAPPGRPTVTAVQGSDGQATVSFTPGADGVPAEASYVVTATQTGSTGDQVTTAAPSGSPVTVAGLSNGKTYTFTVTATNATGSTTSASSDPVTVGVAPRISGTPGSGVVGEDYSFSYDVTGEPDPAVTLTDGSLPPGLQLTGGGTVSGTPTEAGTYRFTATVTNAVGSAQVDSTLRIDPAPAAPDEPVVSDVRGGDGQATVSFSPGDPGYPEPTTYSVTATPTGPEGTSVTTPAEEQRDSITVTGLTNGAAYTFAVTATNATGSTTSASSDEVTVGVATTIAGTPPPATEKSAYSFDYAVVGKPAPRASVTDGALPPGLRLSPAGTLSGRPTKAGSYRFTVTATNAVGSDSVDSTITVGPAPRAVVTGVSPAQGPAGGGTTVTVTGSGFTGAAGVLFGAVEAPVVTSTDSKITVKAPAYAGKVTKTGVSVPVRVKVPGGTVSAKSANGRFRYVPGAAVP